MIVLTKPRKTIRFLCFRVGKRKRFVSVSARDFLHARNLRLRFDAASDAERDEIRAEQRKLRERVLGPSINKTSA